MERENSIESETITNRTAALNLARRNAARGDTICGSLFALESMASSVGLGFMATTAQDWRDEDEEDDIRPY